MLAAVDKGLALAVGTNCEIVLHDFSDVERSIIAIENGHVTGREVGDGLDELGFKVLHQRPGKDLLTYRTTTDDGKELRSSSILLEDEQGKPFGAICVNYNIAPYLQAAELLNQTVLSGTTYVQERFQKNVDQVLDQIIRDGVEKAGKSVEDMSRDDKIAVVSYLESRGAFLIRYSVDRVASLLQISKFTVYNYLDPIKAKQSEDEKVTT